MLSAMILFAEETAKKAEETPQSPFPMMLLPILLLGFYFIVLLPMQRKDRKQRESLMASMKKNDEVLTSGGIIGTITNLRDDSDEVTIRIDDNCKVRVKRASIVQVLTAKDAKDTKEEAKS